MLQLPEDFDQKKIDCIAYDKEQNEIIYNCMFEYKRKISYFIFSQAYLKQLRVTEIDWIVKTPGKFYKSLNINLTEVLK